MRILYFSLYFIIHLLTLCLVDYCLFRVGVDIVYYIYVCDIDQPSAIHKLISVGEQVVSLEWHDSGLQLLVATCLGTVSIYRMKVSHVSLCSK